MEPEGLLQCSQEPAALPILRQIYSVHILPPCFPKTHPNLIFHLRLSFPSGALSPAFPTRILHAFFTSSMRATCLIRLILDLITLILLLFGEAV